MASAASDGDGAGAGFCAFLDQVMKREREFRNELCKSRGRGIPFEQSPEILRSIFDGADARRKRFRGDIEKEDRCIHVRAPPPMGFPRSWRPEEPAHAMVGKTTPSLHQPQRFHHVDDLDGFANHNTSNSSVHVRIPDYSLENPEEMDGRAKLGLPIPPLVKEGLPLTSTLTETNTESVEVENLSLKTEQLCNDQSASSFQAVELRCRICQIHCLTAFNLQEHFQGKKHLMKCKEYEQRPPPYKQLDALRCDICSLTFSNICSLDQHFQEIQHLQMCEVYDQKSLSSQQLADFYCDICHVRCPNIHSLSQHCEGKNHVSKCKELSCGRENKSVWCDVCHIPCPNMMSLVQHRAGKKHIMMSLGQGSYRGRTGDWNSWECQEKKNKRTKKQLKANISQ